MLTVSPSFHLGRCELPLGNYSNHSHQPLRATPLRLPAAPGDSRKRCEAWGGRRPVAASLCEAWEASPTGRRLQGQWRYGLNGRRPANSMTDYFVTEAPPTARKASCFRQPISVPIALARPH